MPLTTLFNHEKARSAYEYGTDAISMFGLIVMLYLQQIILKLLPYQKQFKHFDCFSCLIDK